eukprot:1141946-Pelagomonas_calceolata.AAC.5
MACRTPVCLRYKSGEYGHLHWSFAFSKQSVDFIQRHFKCKHSWPNKVAGYENIESWPHPDSMPSEPIKLQQGCAYEFLSRVTIQTGLPLNSLIS